MHGRCRDLIVGHDVGALASSREGDKTRALETLGRVEKAVPAKDMERETDDAKAYAKRRIREESE